MTGLVRFLDRLADLLERDTLPWSKVAVGLSTVAGLYLLGHLLVANALGRL